MNVSKRWTAALACTVVTIGGAAAEATSPPEDTAPITLRIGTDDVPGRPAADQIEEFARQVDELSGGTIAIEPVWAAAGEDQDDWDQQVARIVVGGELELGVIPARAWDTEGVTTMRALHAPFLVTSDELMDAVVTDEIAGEMLAGLDAVGITGLALLPEGLRHVFSFGDPLLTPGDFEGITVRAPTSDTTYALFEALGATPDDLGGPGDRFGVGVADGSVAAAESSFAFAGGLPAAATAAGNVTLYPKVNVVVANSAALDGLDETEQEVLRDAAIATRDWAITNNRDDADYAPEFCANGGTIVLASDEEVAGLVEATGPVYSELEADAATAAMITRIRALAEEVGPGEPITACTYESPVTLPPDPAETTGESSPDAAEFPEGTYRMEITAEFLIDAGVDQASAFNHHGTWTLTFDDGTLIGSDVNASTGKVSEGRGVYCVEDGRISIGLLGQPPECGDFWSAGWTLEGDQLQFTDVQSHHGSDLLIETLFGGQPFTRIE